MTNIRITCIKPHCVFGCSVPISEALKLAEQHQSDRAKYGDYGHYVSFEKAEMIDYARVYQIRHATNYGMSASALLRRLRGPR